ncbi:MAG: hypothetical protein JNM62_12135 [Flavobacteriales bacterium]|nr:hypothetical protein [Flavobacteriales bacterium]
MTDRSPWLTFPALDLLGDLVKPTDRVFEYGGGGSTLYWMDHAAEVVTAEHHPEWFVALEKKMAAEREGAWTGHHIAAQSGTLVASPDPADPAHYASSDPAYAGEHFRDYVQCIDRYADKSFDIVLVDGRARTSCVRHAIPKLKQGGLLILDNAEREHYTIRNADVLAKCTILLSGMAPVIYDRDLSETRIYRKR